MTELQAPITLFFDGQCKVCQFDMANLHARDCEQRLRLIDITAPDFDPAAWGFDMHELMAQMHAVMPDGSRVKGVSALRVAYQAVGWEWPFIGMRWRAGQVVYEQAYSIFARHRKLISTTLSPLIYTLQWIQARRATRRMQRCRQGQGPCDVDPRNGNPSR
jgi:predicted DCC family thiol-disulfide oxidoreductase YuxK